MKYDELKKASYRLKELVRFSIICAGFLSKEILKIKIKLYTIRKYKNIFREKRDNFMRVSEGVYEGRYKMVDQTIHQVWQALP